VPPVTRLRPGLPGSVDDVIVRALAKSPAERYGSCGEFAAALRGALVSAPPTQGQERFVVSQPPADPLPSQTPGWLQLPEPGRSLLTPTASLFPPGAPRRESPAHLSTVAGTGAPHSGVTVMPDERRRTRRHNGKAALIGVIAVVIIAAAGILTIVTLPNSHGAGAPALSHPSSHTAKPLSASSPPGPGILRPVGDQSFNPYGTPPGNTEDETMAPDAIDASMATAWSTAYYFNSPYFGGLKPGAGLLIDMGKPITLSSITVIFGKSPGVSVRVEVGKSNVASQSNLGTFVTVAEKTNASGTCTFTAKAEATGRYVLIWLTKLPLTRTPTPTPPPSADINGKPIYQASVYNVVSSAALPGIGRGCRPQDHLDAVLSAGDRRRYCPGTPVPGRLQSADGFPGAVGDRVAAAAWLAGCRG